MHCPTHRYAVGILLADAFALLAALLERLLFLGLPLHCNWLSVCQARLLNLSLYEFVLASELLAEYRCLYMSE